jgi:hypothetical protein
MWAFCGSFLLTVICYNNYTRLNEVYDSAFFNLLVLIDYMRFRTGIADADKIFIHTVTVTWQKPLAPLLSTTDALLETSLEANSYRL